tara:strand:+ start:1449 stop:3035 length:1587 start_codon:yes stop_codon:yes gene_type:complete
MNDLNPLLLQLSVLIPFSAALLLFLAPYWGAKLSRAIAFCGFIAPVAIALWLLAHFTASTDAVTGYAFRSDLSTGLDLFGISLKLGLNGIALPLFLLAGIVGFVAGFYALHTDAQRKEMYWMLLLFMLSGLMGTFASIDIFFFYFFHELALIPTFIMIGIWGGAGRRAAAMEMTIYLTLGAMLSLLGLIAIYSRSGFHSFDLIELRTYLVAAPLAEALQHNIVGLLLFGFGILVSLFPFHTWAPRGYAAAPTSAAMLHAGVLKKFGLYGLIQVAGPLLIVGLNSWATALAWLALGNIVLIGLVTMAQRDLKQMIGYSSVMHMGYCFLGVVCLLSPEGRFLGAGGAVMLMFAHGLSVALSFLLATAIHQRTQTYDLKAMGGLCMKTPVLAAFFVAAILASAGLPGFANFWGEFSIFMGLWKYNPWLVVPAVLGIVISAIYGLRAVAHIFFGSPDEAFKDRLLSGSIQDILPYERICCLVLLGSLLVIGLWPKTISDPLNDSLQKVYEDVGVVLDYATASAEEFQNQSIL